MVTATQDPVDLSSIDLLSKGTGAATDYAVTFSIYDPEASAYPSLLPTASFLSDTGTMSGGAAADSSYGTIYSYLVPGGGYAPNGNILAHSDSVMGDWAFSYDSQDRFATAAQFASTPASQQFAGVSGSWSYDSYGNRTAQSFSNSVYSNWANYNPANNRIATAKSAVAGYVYDASGNTLNDGNNKYWYDAEGQLCAVQSLAVTGLPITQYIYDGMGARIGKGTLSAAPAQYTPISANLASRSASRLEAIAPTDRMPCAAGAPFASILYAMRYHPISLTGMPCASFGHGSVSVAQRLPSRRATELSPDEAPAGESSQAVARSPATDGLVSGNSKRIEPSPRMARAVASLTAMGSVFGAIRAETFWPPNSASPVHNPTTSNRFVMEKPSLQRRKMLK